ncbi:MAG: sulfatase [Verrucomicrobiaceae bacterium]|nr:sulfatase [Verrucomicrobiaceae bacterium]
MLRALLLLIALSTSLLAVPNIVIIYADDLGYGDLGCYGHPTIRTPNLDRMAAEGMRFTQFYSAAEVCTPSRAALLTGRYPVRSGMCHDQIRVLRNNSVGGLPQDEVTLAELLKAQGYRTACIGKWHLGVWANDPRHQPVNHGFDFQFGLPHSNDMNPNPGNPKRANALADQKAEYWNSPLYRGMELVERPADQTTLTRRYTEEAVKFITLDKSKPFFLYFPHTFPHTPLFASKNFKGRSPRGLYGDVVEELDWSVGRVIETLRENGLAENTVVVFSSDNGPWLTMGETGGSAGLLREGKGSTWEGGMRVPGIVWWPGRIKPSVCRDVACTMDLFVTFAKLGGAAAPQDRDIDGMDISPLLFGSGRVERSVFCYYRGQRLYAARVGPWKAHFITQPSYGPEKPAVHAVPMLYNIEEDPSESRDVAGQHPDIISRIQSAVEKHRATVKEVPSQLVGTDEVR